MEVKMEEKNKPYLITKWDKYGYRGDIYVVFPGVGKAYVTFIRPKDPNSNTFVYIDELRGEVVEKGTKIVPYDAYTTGGYLRSFYSWGAHGRPPGRYKEIEVEERYPLEELRKKAK